MNMPNHWIAILTGLTIVHGALAEPPKPNIVVIIADDAGYADWEFMDDYLQSVTPGQAGSPVPTPRLNALRERGVLFTSAYTAAVCSPSRAAIVTGSYQQRIGYEYNINNLTGANAVDGLDPGTMTIFHRMKAEGYTTGAIGKWHLGARANDAGLGNRPENMMVDEFFGLWRGSRGYTVGSATVENRFLRETIRQPFSDTVLENTAPWNTTYKYVTAAFGKGAVDFIARHYDDPEPFFLYVAFTAPHAAIGDSPDIDDPRIASLSGKRKQYASMVLTMDKEIGKILDKIDDPAGDGSVSLTDSTLVVFINDNGGASGNGTVNTPLRDWKGSVYEGGTRVPMIFAGPGIPSNPTEPIVYGKPVHSIDILPSCLAAAGATPLADIDGVNLIPFLDGANTGDPHEFIAIRNGAKVGIRRGDWKLVKTGAAADFQLYDLSTDIAEATNVAAANPVVVERLVRDLTAFETGSDKPRHAGLNKGPDSVNLNDRFRFRPASSGGPLPTGPNVVRNPGFESGTQADSELKYTFAELDAWSNNGTNDTQVGAINNDEHSGTYRGVFVVTSRIPYQITDHTITGGETMLLDFWHKGKSGWDNGDTIDVELFYLDGVAGSPQVLGVTNVAPSASGWNRAVRLFPPITDPAAVGETLGIRFRSNGDASEFVSIDDVQLSTGTNDAGGTVEIPWSNGNAWTDTDSGSTDTLLTLDAFAGAVLEFPAASAFSYAAKNDMTRMTGLEFMVNRLRFTGDSSNTIPLSATLTGNELLFTDDLSGNPPAIHIVATGSNYPFVVSNSLVLYHDLTITGDGDAPTELAGTIRDYFEPRGVVKSGASSVLLSGTHTYTGPTTVSSGAFLLATNASLSNGSTVLVDNAGVLGGDGTVAGSVAGIGTISPGTSVGTLSVGGDAAMGSLVIEVDGASNDFLAVGGTFDPTGATLELAELGGGYTETVYLLASYAILAGPFRSVTNLPPGYRVDYAYDDGRSARNIALVPAASPTPYASWMAASGLSGQDALFAADPNDDGIANGLAFFLGAPNAGVDAATYLPMGHAVDGHLIVTFDRAAAAVAHAFLAEYRTNLLVGTWMPARPGLRGVTVTFTNNGATDRIAIDLPASLRGEAGTLFGRLVVTE